MGVGGWTDGQRGGGGWVVDGGWEGGWMGEWMGE